MSTTTNPTGYLVRRFEEAPSIPCPCGLSTRLLTIADGPLASFHVTEIKDSAKHYHRNVTELYYILEGRGTLELGADLVEVEPGMLIQIDPLTTHRLRSEEGVRTIVLALPAIDPEDEYLVDD